MKLPFSVLKDLVPGWSQSPEALADLLTFSGTEVEGIRDEAGDRVLECAVTSNRPDCLGWLGLARDVAAAADLELRAPACEAPAAGGPTRDAAWIRVEDPRFCPRYVGLVVEGVRVGPSPKWLVAALERMGARPVNNVVDVTNYVLFERGQPLHAFDLDRLRGGGIVVRRGRTGETLKALNGREYPTDGTVGVICDAEGPAAIAGVMGGAATEVGERTVRILVESAFFDPASVRRTSRRLQLRSDASHRFERGVDLHGVLDAGLRAARLILETAGGVLRAEPLDVAGGADHRPPTIAFRPRRVLEVCGVEVAPADMKRLFAALGARVDDHDHAHEAWKVTPPAWRRDLAREIDLVEEIVRLVGLHRVPMGAGLRVVPVRPHPARRLAETVRDRCVQLGLAECVTPTFVSEGADADVAFAAHGATLTARNPVRSGEGALRRSLLPSLLQVRTHNQDQGADRLKLFEVADAFFEPSGEGVVEQVPLLGALIDSVRGEKTVDGDVRDGRGLVEALAELLGLRPTFAPSSSPFLRADRQLEAFVGGRRLGVLGVVSRKLCESARLRAAPVYVELDLRAAAEAWTPTKTFVGLPRFPAVVRDLAFVLDEGRAYADLEAALRAAAPAELETVSFFDEFRGRQIGPGKKSLALTVTFRSDEGTLEGAQVDAWIADLVRAADERLGAKLRG
ncbi:MAG TPA: phenylalanine--tRNA ligase subunit beta [Planctomycetota bacterium]|nr:phenylalanine--tRNA ligase subunit beta [Planctomycetota bacterium]